MLSTPPKFFSFVTTLRLLTVGGRITSALPFAEIVRPRSGNSSTTVPSQFLNIPTDIIVNVLSVYVNHLHSVIWLRIPSFIKLSIYQSSNLPAERCITITYSPQTHISFPNICWYLRQASVYNLHTLIPLCVDARPVSMNIAFLTAMFVGVHSTTITVLVIRKLSRHCVLTENDGGARFVMGLYLSLRNVWWKMWDNNTTDCLVLSRPKSF